VQQPGVTSVIPGARDVNQVESNTAAADNPELSESVLAAIEDIYDRRIRAQVESRW
jgi:aryl-alcohol dehydrogenase-like predicted oxidoreductase